MKSERDSKASSKARLGQNAFSLGHAKRVASMGHLGRAVQRAGEPGLTLELERDLLEFLVHRWQQPHRMNGSMRGEKRGWAEVQTWGHLHERTWWRKGSQAEEKEGDRIQQALVSQMALEEDAAKRAFSPGETFSHTHNLP